MMTVLRDLAQIKADPFHMVDDMMENCPVLDSMPFSPTTDGMDHKFGTFDVVEGGGFTRQDEEPGSAVASGHVSSITTGILSFKIEAGVDSLRRLYGTRDPQAGLAKHVARVLPKIVRNNSMRFEKQVMDLLVRYAVANGSVIDAGGTGSGYAIVAVRWIEDELCGLYNPAGFEQGTLFTATPKYAGGVYVKDGAEYIGIDYKCDIDVLLNNRRCVGALVNVDSTHKPTAEQIDELGIACRAGSDGRSMLVMHPKAALMLKAVKGNMLHMTPADTNVNRSVTAWGTMPVVETYNFGDDGLVERQTV